MKSRKIEFETLPNTRDLAGLVNEEGRKIKQNKLIRSGYLVSASEHDKEVLYSQYQLKRVIDLRSIEEISEKQDQLKDGVELIINVAMPQKSVFPGVTRDEQSMSYLREQIENNAQPIDAYNHMKAMYYVLACHPDCLKAYKSLLDILSKEVDGSTLWHCSMGKDRCGTSTAVILMALGFSLEDIKEDYVYSNYCHYGDNIPSEGFSQYYDVVNADYLDHFYKVIEEKFGSVEGFFKEGLHVDEQYLNKLKEIYLEK